MLHVTVAGWAATLALIAGLLILDWLLLGRRPHAVRFGEAARWSAFSSLRVVRKARDGGPIVRFEQRLQDAIRVDLGQYTGNGAVSRRGRPISLYG